MSDNKSTSGPIMRLFEAHTKQGCADRLIQKFKTTSADVVQDEPGNKGYFLGQIIADDNDVIVFASMWDNLDAVQARFGDDWQQSYLPEGYEDLIEECSVRHFDLSVGWHVNLN